MTAILGYRRCPSRWLHSGSAVKQRGVLAGEGHAGGPGGAICGAQAGRRGTARVAAGARAQQGAGAQAHRHVLARVGQEPEPHGLHLQSG